jgi:hypothetical protein
MGMLQRIRNILRAAMVGRNGVDRLSLAMMWLGVVLLVLATAFSSPILNGVSLAVYAIAIVRIFSRNTVRRSAENRYYLNKTMRFRSKINQIRQAVKHRRNRYKNRKQYRYFKCPNCKSWLRVPRGKGQVRVACGNCKHQFSYISR